MAQTRDSIDDLSLADIRQILLTNYGLLADSIDIVSGELATVARVSAAGKLFALKSLPGTQTDGDIVAWQVKGMRTLQIAGLPVPTITRNLDGDDIDDSFTGGRRVFTVLTDWVSDVALLDVEVSESLLGSIGELAARINIAFANFPAPPTSITHEWEFARAGDTLRQFIPRITDPHIVDIASRMAQLHDQIVQPVITSLPQSVLHQDLHDSNLLIGTDSTGNQCVSGILDFGDMIEGPRIAELIVAAAYAARNHPDPVAAIIKVAQGWNAVVPMTDDEKSVIWVGATSRLAQNVSIWSARSAGPRGAYAQSRSSGTMPTLERLLEVDPEEFLAQLSSALN